MIIHDEDMLLNCVFYFRILCDVGGLFVLLGGIGILMI